MDKNSWCTEISKLMTWQVNTWRKYDDTKTPKLYLRVHYDQLLITADAKILESFNMRYKMKGIYKNDILIMMVSNAKQEIRKIKFQFKCNATDCIQKLGDYFPVVGQSELQRNKPIACKYRNIDDFFKSALENKENFNSILPPHFNNFVKLCLLDPSFPQLVHETEKLLEQKILKK